MNMRHGPRSAGKAAPEKAKNFTGTWKKLLVYCKKYWFAMISALLFAAVGTVLTLISPNKISDLTKTIIAGMMTGIDMDAVARIGFTLVAIRVRC